MKSIAASAYVVEARKFLRFFTGKDYVEFERLLDECDIEGLRNFLGAATSGLGPMDESHWPENLPELEDVFLLADEDESDNLERGGIYLQFDESTLFTKTPTEKMKRLMRNGAEPSYERWTIWG